MTSQRPSQQQFLTFVIAAALPSAVLTARVTRPALDGDLHLAHFWDQRPRAEFHAG